MPPRCRRSGFVASVRLIHRRTLLRDGINRFDRKESWAMKTLLVTIGAATLLAALVSARGPVQWSEDPVHRVSGGGTVEYGGALNTHAFTAQIDANGNVKGQAEFQMRYIDTTMHA